MQDKTTELHDYCEQHSFLPDKLLKDIERYTHLHTLAPRMLSGHLQGAFLTMITKMVEPKVILEIGTFTGYSGLCMAHGLANDGKLITIEYDKENAAIAQEFFDKSSLGDKIQLITGDAKTIIPTLDETLDLVFIDADKEGYSTYFDLVIEKCRTGAMIIADNVLWSGKVMDKDMDKKTAIIDAFNKKIASDDRVEVVMVPLRDGLYMMRVK